jgi:hypothetical protein
MMNCHKTGNSNKERVQSVFHNCCPGLPMLLTVCPTVRCGTLSQMVSVSGFTEFVQHAVGVGTDSLLIKMLCMVYSSVYIGGLFTGFIN